MGHVNENETVLAGVYLIGAENFEDQVLREGKAVLLLCTNKDSNYAQQIEMVQSFCACFGEKIKICTLQEEFTQVFMERYGIKGTPTFVLFKNGCERGRLLGKAEPERLREFVFENIDFD